MVAGAVEVGVVPLPRERVEPRPRRRRSALRPVDGAFRIEDEHLRPGRRGVRRRDDDLDPAVAVQIGRRHAPRLRALAAAARRRGPAWLELQAASAELVRRHGSLVAADDDLLQLVAVEVRDDAGRVDPALRRRPLAEQAPLRVVDERGVERRDDLEPVVAVEVDEPGRSEPARLAGGDRPDEARRRDRRGGGGRGAADASCGRVHGGIRGSTDREHQQCGESCQARHLGTLLAAGAKLPAQAADAGADRARHGLCSIWTAQPARRRSRARRRLPWGGLLRQRRRRMYQPLRAPNGVARSVSP